MRSPPLLKSFFRGFFFTLNLLFTLIWDSGLLKALRWLFHNKLKNRITLIAVILLVYFSVDFGKDLLIEYKKEYDRLNSESQDQQPAPVEGMKLEMIAPGLYTMTGSIETGDCNKIIGDLPTTEHFTVILESPGGSLADGSCLASHLKIRNVTTVIRETPVYDEFNNPIYIPDPERVVCASACGLLFLAGDERYLIGDVWFGIHGPSTQGRFPGSVQQAEHQMLQTASKLLDLLEYLGVEDHKTRQLFISIPGYTMYWLRPTDFHLRDGLIDIATHYRNFWGFTLSSPNMNTD